LSYRIGYFCENQIPMGQLILFILGVIFYFLPSMLASNKKNYWSIFLLNLLLGWTLLGWVISLIWAVMDDSTAPKQTPQQIIINNPSNVTNELSKLVDLKEKGILSEEDFNKAKAKILG